MAAKLQISVEQNTMKNTAPRVGAAGVRGLQASPRDGRRGGAPSTTRAPSPPGRDKKCRTIGGHSAQGCRGQTMAGCRHGETPAGLRPQNTALAEKNPRGADTAVPTEGRDPAGACPPARRPPPPQEPDKGNRPTRAEKPTRPNGRLCYAKRRWGQRTHRKQGYESGGTRNRQNRQSDDRAAAARRQHAAGAAPTKAAAEPTRPTERNKLPSGAQGGGCVGPTRAPRPHLHDDRAAWFHVAQPADVIADRIDGQSRQTMSQPLSPHRPRLRWAMWGSLNIHRRHRIAVDPSCVHHGRVRIPPARARRIAFIYWGSGGIGYINCRKSRAVSTDTATEPLRLSKDIGE